MKNFLNLKVRGLPKLDTIVTYWIGYLKPHLNLGKQYLCPNVYNICCRSIEFLFINLLLPAFQFVSNRFVDYYTPYLFSYVLLEVNCGTAQNYLPRAPLGNCSAKLTEYEINIFKTSSLGECSYLSVHRSRWKNIAEIILQVQLS